LEGLRSLAAAIYEGCIGIAPLGGQLGDLPLPRKKLEEGFLLCEPAPRF
jgi:hypothetical protein